MKTPLFSSLSALFAGVVLTASLFAQPVAEGPSAPQERARSAPVFTIYFENDYFGGTDRHYTNGAKFSWLSRDLETWGQAGWRRSLV